MWFLPMGMSAIPTSKLSEKASRVSKDLGFLQDGETGPSTPGRHCVHRAGGMPEEEAQGRRGQPRAAHTSLFGEADDLSSLKVKHQSGWT